VTVRPASKVQRLAIVAALSSALALSACGRKGSLDEPPGLANNANAGTEVAAPAVDEKGTVLRAGSDKLLPVIRGPKKTIPLDALLN
jgi:predicted small lipoprotein YifL